MKERAYEGPVFADAAKLIHPSMTNLGNILLFLVTFGN